MQFKQADSKIKQTLWKMWIKLIQYYQNGSNEAQNSFKLYNKKMNVNKSSEIMILIMLVDINVDLVKKPVFNILWHAVHVWKRMKNVSFSVIIKNKSP